MSTYAPKEVIEKRVELIKKYGRINAAKELLPHNLHDTGASQEELDTLLHEGMFIDLVRQWALTEHIQQESSPQNQVDLSGELDRMANLVIESDEVFGWNPEFINLSYSTFKSFVQLLLTPREIEARVNTSMNF